MIDMDVAAAMVVQRAVHVATVLARAVDAADGTTCVGGVKRGLGSVYSKRLRTSFLFFSIWGRKGSDMEGSPEDVDVEGVTEERGS